MKRSRRISLRAKAVIMILIVSVMLSTAATIVSYTSYASDMDKKYKETTLKLAKTEAVTLDSEVLRAVEEKARAIYEEATVQHGGDIDLATFTQEEQEAYYHRYDAVVQSEEYQKILLSLQEIARANDVMYIYICIYDLEYGNAIYLIDGSLKGDLTPTGWVDDIEPKNFARIKEGNYDIEPYITNYEEFGWLCTATSSVYSADGTNIANAYVDISMNEVMKERHTYLLWLCILQVGITILLALIFVFAVDRTLVRPVKLLSKAAGDYVADRAEGIASGKSSAISQLDIHTGDEIQELGGSIQKMEQDLNTYIQNLTQITAEKERIGAELNVATQIQASMLPSIFPAFPDREDFDIFASMDPAKEVGGDFYDFFMLDETHLAIVVADVSGKGVPAALFMVIGKTLIKDHTHAGSNLGDVFTEVNHILCESNSEGLFITAFEGVLDLVTGEFRFVNAGHELPFICRKGEAFVPYKVRRSFVLAGMEGMRYKEESIILKPGDKVYQYTDGVTEATDANEQLYGMERLEKFLNTCRDRNPEGILHSVKKDIDRFVGEAPQFDDITMLCLEYKKKA